MLRSFCLRHRKDQKSHPDSYRDRRNASLRCRPLPANRSPTMLGIGLQLFFGSCLFFNGPQETLRGLLCPSPLHSQHHSGPVFPGFFPKLFCGRGQLIFFKKKYRWAFPTIIDLPNSCGENTCEGKKIQTMRLSILLFAVFFQKLLE